MAKKCMLLTQPQDQGQIECYLGTKRRESKLSVLLLLAANFKKKEGCNLEALLLITLIRSAAASSLLLPSSSCSLQKGKHAGALKNPVSTVRREGFLPTDTLTVLETQNPAIDQLYVAHKRRSTDFGALKV